jgi:nucleoside-diphosphate-sugar epimerase
LNYSETGRKKWYSGTIEMPKILITGSNSFIGTNFAKYSCYKDEVKEISLIENKPEEIDFSKYDVVLHLAAIVQQKSRIPENQYFHINRDLCLNVAFHAKKRGIKQFVYLSTLKVFGSSTFGENHYDETSACFPNNAYSKSKLEAEDGLKSLATDNFVVSVIRPPIVYGDDGKGNIRRLIRLVDFYPVLPFNKILNKRNFIYIENLIGYIDRIIERKASGTFIVKDEDSLSTTELIKLISRFLEKKVYLFKLPGFLFRIFHFFFPEIMESLYYSMEFNNDRTKHGLDYSPGYTTEEGIRKTIEFYRYKSERVKNT